MDESPAFANDHVARRQGPIPKHEACLIVSPELGTHEWPPSPSEVGAPVCVRELCVRLSCASLRAPPGDGAGTGNRGAVSGGLSSVASIGGAGLGPYDTHRIYAHYISHNKHLGRSPPPLKQFHRGSKSRRACGELTRTRCPNAQCTLARRHTILRSRCQSYCDAARRLSLVVTPREGSHARFEPLEHRAHVRGAPLHAAPNTPCPPPLMRAPSLSLSLSLSHALRIRKRSGQRFSGSAIPHASPGTALNARRQRVRNSKSRHTQTWPWPNSP